MKNKVSLKLKSLVISATALILLFLLFFYFVSLFKSNIISKEKFRAERTILDPLENNISNIVNNSILLIDGLEAFIKVNSKKNGQNIFNQNFDDFASGLFAGTIGVEAFSIAPKGIIRFRYPTSGLQKVYGHNLLTDERDSVKKNVHKTINTNEKVIGMPIDLLIEQKGFVVRKAIYLNDNFWGLVNIVYVLSPLLDISGIPNYTGNWNIALRDSQKNFFYGTDEILSKDYLSKKIDFQKTYWEIFIAPKQNWEETTSILLGFYLFDILGIIIIFLVTLLIFIVSNRQLLLEETIKNRTKEINELNENLEKEVKKRTQEYEQANQELITKNLDLEKSNLKLNEMSQELEAFAYSVSHDLRAPVRSINGFSNILKEDYEAKLDESGIQLLNRIINSGNKINSLINGMLKLSRITQSEIQITKIDISKTVQNIIKDLQNHYPDSKIEIIVENDIIAFGDINMINILLHNLLENAIKYSQNKDKTIIEFGKIHKNDRDIFYISDNGEGFDINYADRLFIPFQRLHSQQKFPGDGIGLAIAKRVINRHNGKIWAESTIGKGTTFYFYLQP